MLYDVEVGGRVRRVRIRKAAGRFVVSIDDRVMEVDVAAVGGHGLSLLIDDGVQAVSREVTFDRGLLPGAVGVRVGASVVPVAIGSLRSAGRPDGARSTGPQRVLAPMPGRVVRILAAAGERVSSRQPMIVIEAMKMENELRAAADSIVTDVAVRAGQSVEAGELLMVLALEQKT
jgi:biotin carboxyl carrier protein